MVTGLVRFVGLEGYEGMAPAGEGGGHHTLVRTNSRSTSIIPAVLAKMGAKRKRRGVALSVQAAAASSTMSCSMTPVANKVRQSSPNPVRRQSRASYGQKISRMTSRMLETDHGEERRRASGGSVNSNSTATTGDGVHGSDTKQL